MIRVVVVDDDSHLRDLFKMMLELEDGFEVVGEAGDGKAAISRVEECQPDLVMLDLEMPVMDGLEALPRILEAAPRTKVVAGCRFRSPKCSDQGGGGIGLSRGLVGGARPRRGSGGLRLQGTVGRGPRAAARVGGRGRGRLS